MRLEIEDDGTVHVFVSERNVRALLAKLEGYPVPSLCTIYYPPQNGLPKFAFTAEKNDKHYAHPSRYGQGPGEMHPDTEMRMSAPIPEDGGAQ